MLSDGLYTVSMKQVSPSHYAPAVSSVGAEILAQEEQLSTKGVTAEVPKPFPGGIVL